MRVVFDTNVIVAGLAVRGLCHELIEIHLPRHQPILSPDLWDELLSTLGDKLGLEPAELPFLDLYSRHSTWVEPAPLARRVCRDPDDDRVLAAAIAGEAEAIVTGDADLLVLEAFEGVRILAPRGFLETSGSSRWGNAPPS